MSGPLAQLAALYLKDIRLELRSKESLLPMLVLGLLILTIFNFSLETSDVLAIAPGMFWIAFAFSQTLGITRSFALEKEYGTLDSTLLTPVDRSLVFLGKLFSNFSAALLQELFLVPLLMGLFNIPLFPNFGWFVIVILLGTLGFSAVGTLFSAVTVNTRMREVLLPLLVFPIYLPAVIGAVRATSVLLHGEPLAWALPWIKLLAVFDIIFVTLASLLFEYVLEEPS